MKAKPMIPEHEVAELLKGSPYEGRGAGMKLIDDALQNAARAIRAERMVVDMAMLIRQLVHYKDESNGLKQRALDYLNRKGLQGSPLRAEALLNDNESQPV